MLEVPPLDSIMMAAFAVGALFMLRYFLVMRRVWKAVGHRPSFQFGDYFRALREGAFGEDREPERRYAARQLVLGLVFLAVGIGLFAWLAATGASMRMEG